MAGVGLLNGFALLFTSAAYSGGKAVVVTPLLALYPVESVSLAVSLVAEQPSVWNWVAVGLSFLAGASLVGLRTDHRNKPMSIADKLGALSNDHAPLTISPEKVSQNGRQWVVWTCLWV